MSSNEFIKLGQIHFVRTMFHFVAMYYSRVVRCLLKLETRTTRILEIEILKLSLRKAKEEGQRSEMKVKQLFKTRYLKRDWFLFRFRPEFGSFCFEAVLLKVEFPIRGSLMHARRCMQIQWRSMFLFFYTWCANGTFKLNECASLSSSLQQIPAHLFHQHQLDEHNGANTSVNLIGTKRRMNEHSFVWFKFKEKQKHTSWRTYQETNIFARCQSVGSPTMKINFHSVYSKTNFSIVL